IRVAKELFGESFTEYATFYSGRTIRPRQLPNFPEQLIFSLGSFLRACGVPRAGPRETAHHGRGPRTRLGAVGWLPFRLPSLATAGRRRQAEDQQATPQRFLLLLRPEAQATGQAGAEACFRQALEVACRQQAKSWELRAAMSLSR